MYSVLLVTSDESLARLASRFIPHISENSRVQNVANMAMGLRVLEADGSMDAVVFDCSGQNIFEAMNMSDRAGYILPFIMVAGSIPQDMLEEAVNRRIDGFVSKGGRDPMDFFRELDQRITIAVERNRNERDRRIDEKRMNALIKMAKMGDRNFSEIVDFALETSLELTGSEAGYVAMYDKTSRVLRMMSWSKGAMDRCRMGTMPVEFNLDTTGVWGEPIRIGKTVTINDYDNDRRNLKKGVPEGHIALKRLLMIPIFAKGEIIGTAGVGNKATDYTWFDEVQVSILMDDLFSIYFKLEATKNSVFETKVAMELLDTGVVGMMFVMENMDIVMMNSITMRLMGCGKPSISDPISLDTIERDTAVQIRRLINDFRRDGEVRRERLLGSNEHEPYDITVVGGGSGFCVVFTNVSEEIKKDDLIARSMEHIRIIEGPVQTSMHRINRTIQSIDSDGLTEEQSSAIHRMNDAVKFLEDYRSVGIKEPIWVLLSDVLKRAVRHIDLEGVDLSADIGKVSLLVDPAFHSVFTNLVNNSVVHGKATRIEIGYSISKGNLTVLYSDNGCGIPPGYVDRLFSLVDEGKFGMFLIDNIISASGLSIEFLDSSKVGSTFAISVPPDKYELR